MNNAGVGRVLPIEWIPLSLFESTADANLWGLIDVIKTFLPLVKKAQGRVVNFAGVAGKYMLCKYLHDHLIDSSESSVYPQ